MQIKGQKVCKEKKLINLYFKINEIIAHKQPVLCLHLLNLTHQGRIEMWELETDERTLQEFISKTHDFLLTSLFFIYLFLAQMTFSNIPYQTSAGLNWIFQQSRSIWTIIVADNLIWHNRNIPAKNMQRSPPGALKPVCVLNLFIRTPWMRRFQRWEKTKPHRKFWFWHLEERTNPEAHASLHAAIMSRLRTLQQHLFYGFLDKVVV